MAEQGADKPKDDRAENQVGYEEFGAATEVRFHLERVNLGTEMKEIAHQRKMLKLKHENLVLQARLNKLSDSTKALLALTWPNRRLTRVAIPAHFSIF